VKRIVRLLGYRAAQRGAPELRRRAETFANAILPYTSGAATPRGTGTIGVALEK